MTPSAGKADRILKPGGDVCATHVVIRSAVDRLEAVHARTLNGVAQVDRAVEHVDEAVVVRAERARIHELEGVVTRGEVAEVGATDCLKRIGGGFVLNRRGETRGGLGEPDLHA